MSDRELFMHDVRVRDRFLAEGTITKADVDRRLAALPDLADQCEDVDLEQPALSTEPDESVVVAPVELRPSVERREPSFGDSAREAIPAIAESQPALGSHDPMKTLVSAVSSEATPAQDAAGQGVSSVPPPTASVDADWGDS